MAENILQRHDNHDTMHSTIQALKSLHRQQSRSLNSNGRTPVWATKLQIWNQAQHNHNGLPGATFSQPVLSLLSLSVFTSYLISLFRKPCIASNLRDLVIKITRTTTEFVKQQWGQKQCLEPCWDWYGFVFPLTSTCKAAAWHPFTWTDLVRALGLVWLSPSPPKTLP